MPKFRPMSDTAAERPPTEDRLRRALVSRPTFGGLAGAAVFWWQSLSPTLMPRTWVGQAAMSAICLAIGMGLGTLGGNLAQRGLRRFHRSPSRTQRATAWRVFAGLAVVAVLAGMALWLHWQNAQRKLVTLDPLRELQRPGLALNAHDPVDEHQGFVGQPDPRRVGVDGGERRAEHLADRPGREFQALAAVARGPGPGGGRDRHVRGGGRYWY